MTFPPEYIPISQTGMSIYAAIGFCIISGAAAIYFWWNKNEYFDIECKLNEQTKSLNEKIKIVDNKVNQLYGKIDELNRDISFIKEHVAAIHESVAWIKNSIQK